MLWMKMLQRVLWSWLFTDTSALVSQTKRDDSDTIFTYAFAIFMPQRLFSCFRRPISSRVFMYENVCFLMCQCQSDRTWWSVVCQTIEWGQSLPGSRRRASPVLRAITTCEPCSRVFKLVHLQALTECKM